MIESHYTVREVAERLKPLMDLLADAVAARVLDRLNADERTPLLNIEDAARRIGRSPGAVRQLVARGEIVAIRAGRRVQVESSELEAWIERNRTA